MARPRQVSDRRILEVARDVFLEHGPGVSTQVIADEVGLSQPALFKRFGTKRELMLQSLMSPVNDAWFTSLGGPADPDTPARDQLQQRMQLLLAFFLKQAPAIGVLKASGIDLHEVLAGFDEAPPVRVRRELAEWMQRMHQDGLFARAPFDSLALVLMASIQGRVMLEHVANMSVPPDYLDDVLDLFWRRLAPEESP